MEIINDINGELINFYRVLKNEFSRLKKEVDSTLHSREIHREARIIYNYPEFFDRITRAWALWVLSRMGFSGLIDGSWGYDIKTNKTVKTTRNSINNFTKELSDRLENVQIECEDALKVIRTRDTKNTFSFIDPLYVGSDQGHYKGYTDEDFENLLNLLSGIKGKFILTMFPHEILKKHIKKNRWTVKEIERRITAAKTNRREQKELLVMNYKIDKRLIRD